VDVSGYVLTTNLRDPWGSNVPSRTLQAGERLRLTAAQLGVTFAPDGELGLFDRTGINGMKDALFYGRLPPGKFYEREASGRWTVK
jgi:spore coat protein H